MAVTALELLHIGEAQILNGMYLRGPDLSQCMPAADGSAGGTHILVSAAVSGGQLNIFKVQIVEKRWVRGADRDGKGAFESFTLV